MPLYEIHTLDVWGNAAEGFEINNQFRAGTIYAPPTEDFDVVAALVDEGHLNARALEEHEADTLQVEYGDGTIEISETDTELAVETRDGHRWLDVHGTLEEVRARAVEDELLEEGESPDDIVESEDQRPLLILNEIRLTYNEGMPFWREHRVVAASPGNMTPDEHALEITASIDSRTDPKVLTIEVSVVQELGPVERDASDNSPWPPPALTDSFDYWFADWVRGPRVGWRDKSLGFDPLTRSALTFESDQDEQGFLVALDEFLGEGTMTLTWNTLRGWLEAQGFGRVGIMDGKPTDTFMYPPSPLSLWRPQLHIFLRLNYHFNGFYLRLQRDDGERLGDHVILERDGDDLSADQVAREVEEFLVAYDAEAQKAPSQLGAIHPGDPDFEDMDDPHAVADFDADVLIDAKELTASVQVDVWPRSYNPGHRGGPHVERRTPGKLDPAFYLYVHHPYEGTTEATIKLSSLNEGEQPSMIYGSIYSGHPMTIPPDTRQQMLVWWDQHGEEVEARGPLAPDERVKWFLAKAGLPFKPCGLNADWNVEAWALSPGKPNVAPGVYLLDTEEEIRNGVPRYALVWREYDPHDEGDGIEGIAEGTLAEMIARAKEELS